ncbi:MAG: N-acylglucosamine 2-epimerase [Planctomycetaceae bacterium]|nr:N-acylglucosamine 2-epimerase [Planctomycetaceae bacterium]
MDENRISQLIEVYRDGLLDNTLPFWIPRSVDHEFGGFMFARDRDGELLDSDKGVWQQGRFTWLLGKLYNHVEPREEWLQAALLGARFMDEHCFDPLDGRMWFHVTRGRKPIRKRRYAFSESFASIAYGELAKATGDDQFAEKARQTFKRFVDHNLDPQGVEPKFTDVRPLKAIGFPMITIVTAQELRVSIDLPEATEWIDRSIESICRDHLKPDIECVMETVGPHGEMSDHFDGRTLNPGHAIEGAWFIMHEGKLRGDSELINTGLKMLDWMWARGWDPEYGGLLYFVDVNKKPLQEYWHDMKFWWPHNEAIIATLLAYQLTGDPKYAEWHALVHDWSYKHFVDHEHGEWYGYLHRDGRVSVPLKGNYWKGPFHLPRMQYVCWQILEEMQSA